MVNSPLKPNPLAALLFTSLFAAACAGTATSNPDGGNPYNGSDGGVVVGGTITSLTSLRVSGAEVGKQGRLRIAFTNPVSDDVDVALASTVTATAKVQASVKVPKGSISFDAPYDAVGVGTSTIQATSNGITLSQPVSVVDHLTITTYGGGAVLEVGAVANTNAYLNIMPPNAVTISLNATNPAVATVPSQVVINPFGSNALYDQGNTVVYPVTAVGPGNTGITLTVGSETSQTGVTVVAAASLDSCSVGSNTVEVGSDLSVSVSLDAIAGKPTSVQVTSNSAVVESRAVVVGAGQNYGSANFHTTGAGSARLTATLGTTTKTVDVSIAAAQLRSISDAVMYVDQADARLVAYLNVIASKTHKLTLTSSDAAVLSVPSETSFLPGRSSQDIAVAPHKAGTVTVTAELDGKKVSAQVNVVEKANAVKYIRPNSPTTKVVIGDSPQQYFSTSLSGPFTLTSSDSTVVSVPDSVYGSYFSLAALKEGKARITISADGISAGIDVIVVASARLQNFGPTFSIPVGGSFSGQLNFDVYPRDGTLFTFTSSNAAVLAPPDPVVYAQYSAPFSLRGLASGTAIVTVTWSGGSTSGIAYVGDTSAGASYLNSVSIQGPQMMVGAATYAYVALSSPAQVDVPYTVTFSKSGVVEAVGAPFVIGAGASSSTFGLRAVGAGSTNVIVTSATGTQTGDVTVVATPTFSLSIGPNVTVGDFLRASISANQVLAANVTFTVTSSAGDVAAVSTNSLVLGPQYYNSSANFGVQGLKAGSATITLTAGSTVLHQDITVTP